MYLYTDYLTINSTDIIETEFKNKSFFTNNQKNMFTLDSIVLTKLYGRLWKQSTRRSALL